MIKKNVSDDGKKLSESRGMKSQTSSVSSVAEQDVVSIPVGRFTRRLSRNPWIISTFVFGILAVIFALISFRGGVSGGVVSVDSVGDSVVSFINENPAFNAQVSLVSAEREGSLYKITVRYQNQELPLYATPDGKFLVPNLVSLSADQNPGTTPEIGPSENERVDVSEDDDAVIGRDDAPITIVEFSDYQCPFCRKFWTETYSQIKKDYIDTGKVRLVFRDFPLSFHPMAIPAAIAAECVREKGKDSGYFRYHDKLFEEQNKIDGGSSQGPVTKTVEFTNDDLKKWAKELGYNIDSCLDSEKYKDEVQADFEYGGNVGIQGTPGFFINGVKIDGALPYAQFKSVIDAELANAPGIDVGGGSGAVGERVGGL